MTRHRTYTPISTLIWLLCVLLLSCSKKSTKQLDLRAFEKHQTDGSWQYTSTTGEEILVRKDNDEYWEEITGKGEYFTQRNDYYLNGRLKVAGLYFHDGGFSKGIWTYYDKDGSVLKTEDAPFTKYPWEQVLIYLNKNRVNILDKFTRVYSESGAKGAFWQLSWRKGRNEQGLDTVRNVRIDLNSGQIIVQKETYCCID